MTTGVIPNQPPVRYPSGVASDPPYGPWADSGIGNPFFYHLFEDDFDNSIAVSNAWTVSATSGGTAAETAGDGGLITLTPDAASDYVSIQLPKASFTLPQGTLAGKKLFFLTRLQVSSITEAGFVAGLVNTTTTPFTSGDITDGIWYSMATGGTALKINVASGGTVLTTAVATNTYSIKAATNIDLAFYVDRYGNVQYSVGSQLVGWIPQSGTGASTGASGVPSLPVMCPTGKLYSGNQPGTIASGYTLSTANLTPTLGVTCVTAVATLKADFIGVGKER